MGNTEIINILEEEGIGLTEDINEAIYIMSDGKFISGMYDCGVRGTDHRVIECLFGDIDRHEDDFWDVVLKRAKLVMYVPETKTILLKDNQVITDDQLEVIEKHDKSITVEYF
ncbi:hypothetical protein [Staphylococcus aureus]|uniref:hypothetical protein n=1 Tax=Staphylococcus aureus TaxID=1280 RepID=UPI001BFE78DD|nr:hypothetical protein [Staphylococcus aureus]